MAGDIDDTRLVAARQLEPGEAQVDGHPALFLFPETVRVDARQGLDESGLAMVDVTRGAYDVQGRLIL